MQSMLGLSTKSGGRAMTKKIVGAIALALIIGSFVAWYFLSPQYAMHQLREAALAGDRQEIIQRIDFPSIRESLKSQMQAEFAANAAEEEAADNPFGKLGNAMAMGMFASVIDAMVTPDAMVALIKTGKIGPKPDATSENSSVEWVIERDGFDRFRAFAATSNEKPTPTLVFTRDGFSWRLVDIEIPTDKGKTTAAKASPEPSVDASPTASSEVAAEDPEVAMPEEDYGEAGFDEYATGTGEEEYTDEESQLEPQM